MGGAYDNKSPATIVSATAVLVAVDILVVSTRVYIRRSLKQPYYVEDWLSISALVKRSWTIANSKWTYIGSYASLEWP